MNKKPAKTGATKKPIVPKSTRESERERARDELERRLAAPRLRDSDAILVTVGDLRLLLDGPELTSGEVVQATQNLATAAMVDLVRGMTAALPPASPKRPRPWATAVPGASTGASPTAHDDYQSAGVERPDPRVR